MQVDTRQKKQKTKLVSFKAPLDLIEALAARAKKEDRTVSAVVRVAVRNHLNGKEDS